jgi:hypothetical protein
MALAVILGMATMASADHGGMNIRDDQARVCPSGLIPVQVLTTHPYDLNRNGLVCVAAASLGKSSGEGKKQDTGSQASAESKSSKSKQEPRPLIVVDDQGRACPDDFVPVIDRIPRPEDQNRNGVVCMRTK